jgi:hypothetical protein
VTEHSSGTLYASSDARFVTTIVLALATGAFLVAAVSLTVKRGSSLLGVAVSFAVAVAFGICAIRAARSGVRVENDRVLVRNITRTHTVPIGLVEMFTVGPAPLWFFASSRVAVVQKADRGRIVISSIEPNRDGESLLNDLNGELDAVRGNRAVRGPLVDERPST